MTTTPTPPSADELAQRLGQLAAKWRQNLARIRGVSPNISGKLEEEIEWVEQAAALLRTLAAVTRERDEARRMLGEADAVIAQLYVGKMKPLHALAREALSRHRQRTRTETSKGDEHG